MVDSVVLICYNKRVMENNTLPQFDRERHGGLWERGGADSYYRRGPEPHWYPEGTYVGQKITELTPAEIAEYMAGYEYNEKSGCHKEW